MTSFPSSAQTPAPDQPALGQEEILTPGFFHTRRDVHVSSLAGPSLGLQSCAFLAFPMPAALLRRSLDGVLIHLKMVLLILVPPEHTSEQEDNLLNEKPCSQPLLHSFCCPICHDSHKNVSDCHNKEPWFRMLFCLAYI